MDLKKLEYLLQVAEYGSFTKAAAVIGIAQPALGRQVQKLEVECGVPLLYRHGRGVVLTPEGEALVQRVQPLIRQLQHATKDLRADAASVGGLVTVGLTPTVGCMIGLALVKSLRAKFPKLRVNIVEAYSGYVHEWLMDARLDLAILHDARRSQHLLVEPLAAARLSLIAPPGTRMPGSTSGTVPLKRLSGIPLVLPTRNHGLRRALEYAASQAGAQLEIDYEVDTMSLAIEMVRAGVAHTVLAQPAVDQEHRRGELQSVRLAAPHAQIKLMMARAANRPYTRSVQLVETEIREQIAQAVARFPLHLINASETLKA